MQLLVLKDGWLQERYIYITRWCVWWWWKIILHYHHH